MKIKKILNVYNEREFKVFVIFGIKLKIRSKVLMLRLQLNELKRMNKRMEKNIYAQDKKISQLSAKLNAEIETRDRRDENRQSQILDNFDKLNKNNALLGVKLDKYEELLCLSEKRLISYVDSANLRVLDACEQTSTETIELERRISTIEELNLLDKYQHCVSHTNSLDCKISSVASSWKELLHAQMSSVDRRMSELAQSVNENEMHHVTFGHEHSFERQQKNALDQHYIDLAVIADDKFMIPSIVMLTSAKLNKKANSFYRVHFVCVEVSDYFKKKLQELESTDFRIMIYDADVKKYSNVNISIHVTASTFLKMDLAQILPHLDKVLHIDGDALVYSDLTELFETDIEENPLAVVRALSLEQNGELQKRIGVERGFNAGIMLMNLKIWREMNATQELCQMLLDDCREWKYLEQDCMNVYFHDNAKYLPVRYNMMSCIFRNRGFSIDQINSFYDACYTDFSDMLDDTVILHMAGTPKCRPWEVINGVHGNEWQYYYDLSPLKNHYLERKIWDNKISNSRIW